MSMTEFMSAIAAGEKWGWRDRRDIDGTVVILTGPHKGEVLNGADR